MQVVDKNLLLSHATQGAEVYYEYKEGTFVRSKIGKIYPLPEQEVFAEELLRYLTAKISLDGGWRVVWKEPKKSYWDKMGGLFRAYVPTVVEMEFLDKDGDVVCSIFSEDKVWDMLELGMTNYANQAYNAVMAAREFLKTADIRPEQTYKRALGEKPSDPNAEVPL